MASPNIVNVSIISGVTTLVSSIATGTTGSVLIPAVVSNHVYKLNAVTVANKTASSIAASVAVTRSSSDYYLAYQVTIPANASLSVLDKNMQIYLQESDSLKGIAGSVASLDAVVSYEDIS